jgi:alpha-glucuronidase
MATKKHKRLANEFAPFVLFCGLLFGFAQGARADDGYRLWLRYDQLKTPAVQQYRRLIKSISVLGNTATFDVIRRELSAGCTGLLGTTVIVGDRDDASVIVGMPESSALIRRLRWETELKNLGPEGFRIRSVKDGGRDVIVIASTTGAGALYHRPLASRSKAALEAAHP